FIILRRLIEAPERPTLKRKIGRHSGLQFSWIMFSLSAKWRNIPISIEGQQSLLLGVRVA
ncbi:hypothetical protein Smp_178340, partial [Schistosoma mansoni]|uniref:hypothetical protein n=1 Tax=Schistosoma mansoni TaxID=6183 RepID=UPI0001A62006